MAGKLKINSINITKLMLKKEIRRYIGKYKTPSGNITAPVEYRYKMIKKGTLLLARDDGRY